MSIFASVSPTELHRDPAPYAMFDLYDKLMLRAGWAEHLYPDYDLGEYVEFSPRPEYIPVTAHEPNPVLIDFREFSGIASMWLEALDDESFLADTRPRPTEEQLAHARRVLTRLAALEASASK